MSNILSIHLGGVMKTATQLIVVVVLLLSSLTFSQVNIRVDSDKFFQERINSKPNSNERVFGTLELDSFKDKESRTIVNKTILDNGFHIVFHLMLDWDGSNWVNDEKWTFTSDGNNNLIEHHRCKSISCHSPN